MIFIDVLRSKDPDPFFMDRDPGAVANKSGSGKLLVMQH